MTVITVKLTLRNVLVSYDPFVRAFHEEVFFPISLQIGLDSVGAFK